MPIKFDTNSGGRNAAHAVSRMFVCCGKCSWQISAHPTNLLWAFCTIFDTQYAEWSPHATGSRIGRI